MNFIGCENNPGTMGDTSLAGKICMFVAGQGYAAHLNEDEEGQTKELQ